MAFTIGSSVHVSVYVRILHTSLNISGCLDNHSDIHIVSDFPNLLISS